MDPDIVMILGRVVEKALKADAILASKRVLVTVHSAAAMRCPWMGRRFRRDLKTLKRALARERPPGRRSQADAASALHAPALHGKR
ncbi:MAG: hypothetical protein DMD81_25025 [Candidatus Rokuibacteriota bacterium]|nr:MAG: hypothetical protein DMD81_25025 [Candidatus Rokubacteria bacterium]